MRPQSTAPVLPILENAHINRLNRTARRFGFRDWPSYFWSKVDRSSGLFACWPWTAKLSPDGYGLLRYGRRNYRAHRVAWMLANGLIPPGQECLHRCDNPACCNVSHLFLGTQAENIADMMAKGRSRKATGDDHWTRQHPERVPHGEGRPTARLTAEQVREIRRRYAAGGTSWPKLAREYGVTHSLIGQIIHRKAWTHVD